MSDDTPSVAPAGPAPLADDSPISDRSIEAGRADVGKIWKRIAMRAPDAVRAKVEGVLARAEAIIGRADARQSERLEIAKTLEDLGAELRGRQAFEPSFYTEGRLAIIHAWDTVRIQGCIDHVRVEEFFARYLQRAEKAFERLDYFFTRAGLLQPKEKAKKAAWEQPYAQMEQYRELIWGRTKKPTASKPPGHRPIG